MILYYFEACPFCQRVLRTIDKLNIKSEIDLRDVRKNADFAQELKRLTGLSQVPCLVIDGKPMLESADINAYLTKRFTDGTR